MPVTSYAWTTLANTPQGITVTRADAALPQGTETTYFTVNGTIELLYLVGTVGTVLGSTPNNLCFNFLPSGGTSAAITGVVEGNAAAAGAKLVVHGPVPTTGALTTVMTKITAGGIGSTLGQSGVIILSTGSLKFSAVASTTGTTSWVLRYRPITAGASVTSA